jgi:hypothetical protein
MNFILAMLSASAEPMTITTETDETLNASEVFILELDANGNLRNGPSLQTVIESSFKKSDVDWEAGVTSMLSFHTELGESNTVIASADVGQVLGTESGARSCTCNAGCSSSNCEYNVEVDALFTASLSCEGTCGDPPCEQEATDPGDDQQTSTPGPEIEDGDGWQGTINAPADYCDGTTCEEQTHSMSSPGYNEDIIDLLEMLRRQKACE